MDRPPDPAPQRVSRAVVGPVGRSIHYAEADRPEGVGPRLQRLGTCDFDVDIESAVFGDGDPADLDTVATALREVFGEGTSRTLVVVAPPTRTTSFFTPLPAELAPAAAGEHLRQEASLLADVAPTQPVRVRAVPIRIEAVEGGARRWFHVVHVPEPVHARLGLLAQALGATGYDLIDSTRAGALAVLARVGAGPGLYAAVGAHPAHTEVAVVRDGAFLFGHVTVDATPADTAYFAFAALQRVGVGFADLDGLYAYGSGLGGGRLDELAAFAGHAPAPLDVLDRFGRRPEGVPAETLAAFAPVLGGALV